VICCLRELAHLELSQVSVEVGVIKELL